jgi:hypothetical protein
VLTEDSESSIETNLENGEISGGKASEGAAAHGQNSEVVPVYGDAFPDLPQWNSCYAHNWPYFRDPVHPYSYSEDWDLEDEWNERQGRLRNDSSGRDKSA